MYSVKFRKDGLACFTGEQSGTINHLDLSGNLIATFTGHSSTVCSLECTDTELLSGSWDATAKLWDINTGNCTVTISSEHH